MLNVLHITTSVDGEVQAPKEIQLPALTKQAIMDHMELEEVSPICDSLVISNELKLHQVAILTLGQEKAWTYVRHMFIVKN